jgi:hypothetical protein
VVDHFSDRILFVQVGERGHCHPVMSKKPNCLKSHWFLSRPEPA